jgi:HlyD family secretion protein
VLRVPDPSERVVAAGTPLLEVGDPRRIEIVTDLLSSDAVQVHQGDEMRVEGWGGDSSLTGHVIRVEPSGFTKVSALGVEEQRVNVIGILDTVPAGLGDRFRVEVRVVVWRSPEVLRLPASALFRLGSGWAVFEVEDGRAHRRLVSVGHRSGFDVEVTGGLNPGATVIRDPGDQVIDGGRVRAR